MLYTLPLNIYDLSSLKKSKVAFTSVVLTLISRILKITPHTIV